MLDMRITHYGYVYGPGNSRSREVERELMLTLADRKVLN